MSGTLYATVADLEQRMGEQELAQLTDPLHSGSPDPALALAALADASAEIDGYLAVRYRLPLPTVPTVLVRMACDLARLALWRDVAPERVVSQAEHARRLLRDLSRGAMSLGLAQDVQAPTPSQASVSVGAARAFGRQNTGAF